MLNKELSHFAEHNKSDNQIAEYICNTYLDKSEEVELTSSENDDKLDPLPGQQPLNKIKSMSNANLLQTSNSSSNLRHNAYTDAENSSNPTNTTTASEMTQNEASTPSIPKLTVDLFNTNAREAANETNQINQSGDADHVRLSNLVDMILLIFVCVCDTKK